MIKFGLIPTLRVSAVRMGSESVPFIQEDRKDDGSFYVVMPQAMAKGQDYSLEIEYAGDKVVRKAGNGNFSVEARTSWYPSLNSFSDQAKYHLTFRAPRQYTLVSVGKRIKETRDKDVMVSEWDSEVPIAVAGFNYDEFKKKELTLDTFPYALEGYANSDLPDYLKSEQDNIGNISPSRLTEQALAQTQAALKIFDHWFGRPTYGRIAITQQPDFDFGQSWPTLVYLPISAFLDATQRWRLMGGISNSMNDFIQEVTPHEVSHQWWGHMVGWKTYRDQWLSEGFADFSAGLFLQYTQQKPDRI